MYLLQGGESPYMNFVDICTIANISILIFTEDLTGYYIHGKSPYGHADVPSLNLRLSLCDDSVSRSSIRGLHPTVAEH